MEKFWDLFYQGARGEGRLFFEFHGDMNFFTLRKILEDRNEAL
jgi:hypothetical protein